MDNTSTPRLKPVERIKFDRWLFDLGLDNTDAGELLGLHPLTIGRYRKRFDDPDRRLPDSATMLRVERLSAGFIGLQDWHQPCPVFYDKAAVSGQAAA